MTAKPKPEATAPTPFEELWNKWVQEENPGEPPNPLNISYNDRSVYIDHAFKFAEWYAAALKSQLEAAQKEIEILREELRAIYARWGIER